MLNPAPASPLGLTGQVVVMLLRIAIGWHFLYEGLYKLEETSQAREFARYHSELRGETYNQLDFSPPGGFSAKAYLDGSTGPFAEMFQSWSSDPVTLNYLNAMVIAGLIVCGGCFMFGLFTRLSGLGLLGMLTMFYISAPPWQVQQTAELVTTEVRNPITVVTETGDKNAKVARGQVLDSADEVIPTSNGKVQVKVYETRRDGTSVAVIKTGVVGADRVWITESRIRQLYLQDMPAFALPGAKKPAKGPSEGHYFLVNKNLIEFLAVVLLLCCRAGFAFGLDGLVRFAITGRLFKGNASPQTDATTAQRTVQPTVEEASRRSQGGMLRGNLTPAAAAAAARLSS